MAKKKILLYLLFLLISSNLVAQIDSVTFQFIPDASTFKIKCRAQKYMGPNISDFVISDTTNSEYTFDWGGSIEPTTDGLPTANFEFSDTGKYNFTLSVVEKSSAGTFTDTKIFRIQDFISIPNVFTPNEDGVNDLFIVRSNGIEELEIG